MPDEEGVNTPSYSAALAGSVGTGSSSVFDTVTSLRATTQGPAVAAAASDVPRTYQSRFVPRVALTDTPLVDLTLDKRPLLFP